MAPTDEVIVGLLGRPHGIKGEVTIDVRTDEPERRFTPGVQLRVEQTGRTLTVASARWISGRLVVRFDEMVDRTEVESARGWVLLTDVPSDELPPDDQDYYIRHLLGMEVRRADGTTAGIVKDVRQLPAQDLLVVDVDGFEAMVPFVTALVPQVNLAEGWLQLADVGGLLEDGEF